MSDFLEEGRDELPPYARSLGVRIHERSDEGVSPILAVDFSDIVEGRPGVYHGGATSGLLEIAGFAALHHAIEPSDTRLVFKPISVTVQFLSAAKNGTTYAQAHIKKMGRRNVNLFIEAWQDNRERPIATAVMNILLRSHKS